MAKTNISWGVTIGVVSFIFLMSISLSAGFIYTAIQGGMTVLNLILGLFLLGVLPILWGIFFLVQRARGRDYELNELEDNTGLPCFVMLMRLITGLIVAGFFLAMFLVLRSIEVQSLWAIILITILEDLMLLALLTYLLLAIGKTRYFREHKNKKLLQTVFVAVVIGLFVLVNILMKI